MKYVTALKIILEKIRLISLENRILLFVYRHTIALALYARRKDRFWSGVFAYGITYQEDFDNAYAAYKVNADENCDNQKIKKDIIISNIIFRTYPWEYFAYRFSEKTLFERAAYLSDYDRFFEISKLSGIDVFYELQDKWFFYNLTSSYFKREVCLLNKDTKDEVKRFLNNNKVFFAKPLRGTVGKGAQVCHVDDCGGWEELYAELCSSGEWILEEVIKQSDVMSKWNQSSVNTLRIPSFRTGNGVRILQPFMRTGRRGKCVDNGGSGGIFAVVDIRTGKIISDGSDERGNIYQRHPDSQLVYKGFSIPRWEELMLLVKEIHQSLPEKHKYVGFDFALTDSGWCLIEGNWGQFLGQISSGKGIRHDFFQCIKE